MESRARRAMAGASRTRTAQPPARYVHPASSLLRRGPLLPTPAPTVQPASTQQQTLRPSAATVPLARTRRRMVPSAWPVRHRQLLQWEVATWLTAHAGRGMKIRVRDAWHVFPESTIPMLGPELVKDALMD